MRRPPRPRHARQAQASPADQQATEPLGVPIFDDQGDVEWQAASTPSTPAEGIIATLSSRNRHTATVQRAAEGTALARARRRQAVRSWGRKERDRERQAGTRRRTLHLIGMWLAGALVLGLLVWAVGFSSWFAVDRADITVTGTDDTLSAQSVVEDLEPYVGMPLIRVDLGAVGERVADDFVRVRSATVTREWPQGLRVAVDMRTPVITREHEGTWDILDRDAVVIGTATEQPEGLVLVTGLTPAEQGEDTTVRQIEAVADAVGALSPGTREQVVSAGATPTGQVSMVLSSGATVIWGDHTFLALKSQVLDVLMSTEASIYDVSSPHAPTTQ